MLWLDEDTDVELKRNFISNIVEMYPLGLVVSGFELDKSFDILIELVSTPKIPRQIITGSIEGKGGLDALFEFLSSIFPADELFDEWLDYEILGISRLPFDEEKALRTLSPKSCNIRDGS